MPMTRKDFNEFAETVKRLRERELRNNGTDAFVSANDLIDELCSIFKRSNMNFCKQKFKEACEV